MNKLFTIYYSDVDIKLIPQSSNCKNMDLDKVNCDSMIHLEVKWDIKNYLDYSYVGKQQNEQEI